MDFFVKLLCFCLVLLHNSERTQSLECPVCVHATFKFLNMPSFLQSQVKDSLKYFEDIPCKKNIATLYACDGGNYKSSMKCASVNQTVAFHGIKAIGPNAGMEMHMINRGCTIRPSGEADKCEDISTNGKILTQKALQSIRGIAELFNTVKYSGQVCYSSHHDHQNRTSDGVISSVSYLVLISLALKTLM